MENKQTWYGTEILIKWIKVEITFIVLETQSSSSVGTERFST